MIEHIEEAEMLRLVNDILDTLIEVDATTIAQISALMTLTIQLISTFEISHEQFEKDFIGVFRDLYVKTLKLNELGKDD